MAIKFVNGINDIYEIYINDQFIGLLRNNKWELSTYYDEISCLKTCEIEQILSKMKELQGEK